MLSISKLLSKEETQTIKLPRKRMKIKHEIYLCKECGHLYYYRIIKCPLCESLDVKIVNNELSKRKNVV